MENEKKKKARINTSDSSFSSALSLPPLIIIIKKSHHLTISSSPPFSPGYALLSLISSFLSSGHACALTIIQFVVALMLASTDTVPPHSLVFSFLHTNNHRSITNKQTNQPTHPHHHNKKTNETKTHTQPKTNHKCLSSSFSFPPLSLHHLNNK